MPALPYAHLPLPAPSHTAPHMLTPDTGHGIASHCIAVAAPALMGGTHLPAWVRRTSLPYAATLPWDTDACHGEPGSLHAVHASCTAGQEEDGAQTRPAGGAGASATGACAMPALAGWWLSLGRADTALAGRTRREKSGGRTGTGSVKKAGTPVAPAYPSTCLVGT